MNQDSSRSHKNLPPETESEYIKRAERKKARKRISMKETKQNKYKYKIQ